MEQLAATLGSFFGWLGANEQGTLASLLWSPDPSVQLAIAVMLLLGLAAIAFIYAPFSVRLFQLGQLRRAVAQALDEQDPAGLPARRGRVDDAFLRSPVAVQWEAFLGRWRDAVVTDADEERAPVRLGDVFEESPALPTGARTSMLRLLPSVFFAFASLGALMAMASAMPSGSEPATLELSMAALLSGINMALRTALWGLLFAGAAYLAARVIEGRCQRVCERLDQLVASAYFYASPSELAEPQTSSEFARLRGELAQMLDARFAVQAGAMRSLRELVTEMEQAPKKIDVRAVESVAGSIDQAVSGIQDASQNLGSAAREVDSKLDTLRLVSASLEEVAARAGGDQEARKNAIDLLRELSDGLRDTASEVHGTLSGAGLVGQRDADLATQRSFFEDALSGIASSITGHFTPIDERMQQMSAEVVAASQASRSDQGRIESVASELAEVASGLRVALADLGSSDQREQDRAAQRAILDEGLAELNRSIAERLAPIDSRLARIGGDLSLVSNTAVEAAEADRTRVEAVAGDLRELSAEMRERLTALSAGVPSEDEIEARRELTEESLANRLGASVADRLAPIDGRLERLGVELAALSAAGMAAANADGGSVADASEELRNVALELRTALARVVEATPNEEDGEALRLLTEESLASRVTNAIDDRLGPIDGQLDRIVSQLSASAAADVSAASGQQRYVESATTDLRSVATELRSALEELANAGPREEEVAAERERNQESIANRVSDAVEARLGPIDEQLEHIGAVLVAASEQAAAGEDQSAFDTAAVELRGVATELRSAVSDLATAARSQEESEAQLVRVGDGVATRVSDTVESRLRPIDAQLEQIGALLVAVSEQVAAGEDQSVFDGAAVELRSVATELRSAVGDLATAARSQEESEAQLVRVEEGVANRVSDAVESRLRPIDAQLEHIGAVLVAASEQAAAGEDQSAFDTAAVELRSVATELRSAVGDLATAARSQEESEAQLVRVEEGVANRVSDTVEARLAPIDAQLEQIGALLVAVSEQAAAGEDQSAFDRAASELQSVATELRISVSELADAGRREEEAEAQLVRVEEALASRVSTTLGESLAPIDGRLEEFGVALAATHAATAAAWSGDRDQLESLAGELREVTSVLRETVHEAADARPTEEDATAQLALIEEGLARVTDTMGERLQPIDARLQQLATDILAAATRSSEEEQGAIANAATELRDVASEIRETLSEAITAGPDEEDLVAQRALIEEGLARIHTSLEERLDPMGERLQRISSELAEASASATAAEQEDRLGIVSVANELRAVASDLRDTLSEAVTAGEEDSLTQRSLIEEGLTRLSTSIGERLGPIDDRLERMGNDLAAGVAAGSAATDAERDQLASVTTDLRGVTGELREALAAAVASSESDDDADTQMLLIEEGLARVTTSMRERIDPIDERLQRMSAELSEVAQSGDAAQRAFIEEGLARVAMSVVERIDPIDERLQLMSAELSEVAQGDDTAQRAFIEESLAKVTSSVAERVDPLNERLQSMSAELVSLADAAASDSSQEKALIEAVASDLRGISEELRKSLEPAHGLMTQLDQKTTGFFTAVGDLETHVERAERSVGELRSGIGSEGEAVRTVAAELKQQIEQMGEALVSQHAGLEKQHKQLEKQKQLIEKARAGKPKSERERIVQRALERARAGKLANGDAPKGSDTVIAEVPEQGEARQQRPKGDMPDLEVVRAQADRPLPSAMADPEGSRPPGLSSLLSSKRSSKKDEGKDRS